MIDSGPRYLSELRPTELVDSGPPLIKPRVYDIPPLFYLRHYIETQLISTGGFMYKEEGFQLSAGGTSQWYVNCRNILLTTEPRRAIGEMIWRLVTDSVRKVSWWPMAVGGMLIGALPVAIAVAEAAPWSVDCFGIRREEKSHGVTSRWVGPDPPKDAPVIVVDDVLTTGKSLLAAIAVAQAAGCSVRAAAVVVDREESGLGDFCLDGIPIHSITTLSRLKDLWERK